jgi:hypothetical protein
MERDWLYTGWSPSTLLDTPYRPRSRISFAKNSCDLVAEMNEPRVPSRTSHAETGEAENLSKRSSGVLSHPPPGGLFVGEGIPVILGAIWPFSEAVGLGGEVREFFSFLACSPAGGHTVTHKVLIF